MSAEETDSGFVILCAGEREALYLNHKTTHRLRVAHNVEEAFAEVMRLSPHGLIVDMLSATRAPPEAIRALHQLNLTWPVLRATVHSATHIEISATMPDRRGAFPACLDDIAQWKNPAFQRDVLRLPLRCRARFRVDDAPWQRSTCLDISPSGCFIHAFDFPPIGAHIDIDLRDIKEDPLALLGQVVWSRGWNESPRLPGIGVQLDPSAGFDVLKGALQEPMAVRSLFCG